MRYIGALLLVILFVFMGCSGSPDPVGLKGTSSFLVGITGAIVWDCEDETDALMLVRFDGDIETAFLATPYPGDYYKDLWLEELGGTYRFELAPIGGHTITPEYIKEKKWEVPGWKHS